MSLEIDSTPSPGPRPPRSDGAGQDVTGDRRALDILRTGVVLADRTDSMKKVASTANDELQGLDEFRVSSVFRRPLAPLALTLIALEQLPITDAPKKEEGKKEVTI